MTQLDDSKNTGNELGQTKYCDKCGGSQSNCEDYPNRQPHYIVRPEASSVVQPPNHTGNELDEILVTAINKAHAIGYGDCMNETRSEFEIAQLGSSAKSKLTKYIEQVIGEDDIQKPNDEGYSDWNVCETCEVIMIDESDPPMACNCTVRNQLRAEQRAKLRGESNGR